MVTHGACQLDGKLETERRILRNIDVCQVQLLPCQGMPGGHVGQAPCSLTLRLLMSYIYIYIYMERIFLMFLNHTQRRSTVGRTPLDE